MTSSATHKRREAEFRAAVRKLAASIEADRPLAAEMASFRQVLPSLPLTQMANWERIIRAELALMQHKPFFQDPSALPARAMTWIDLASGNGYVRERALSTLTGPVPSSFFLALAVRRLNDWVQQVRVAARAAVPEFAKASDPEQVVDVLCAMLPGSIAWGRMEAIDRSVVDLLLAVPGVGMALKRRVVDAAAGPMATVLAQSLRMPVLDEYLPRIATTAIQPAVRARAHRVLLAGKAAWVESRHWRWTDVRYCHGRLEHAFAERVLTSPPSLVAALEAAGADRSAIVRRVAAEALITRLDELGATALPLARQFASDVSTTIAARGAFIVQMLEKRASS